MLPSRFYATHTIPIVGCIYFNWDLASYLEPPSAAASSMPMKRRASASSRPPPKWRRNSPLSSKPAKPNTSKLRSRSVSWWGASSPNRLTPSREPTRYQSCTIPAVPNRKPAVHRKGPRRTGLFARPHPSIHCSRNPHRHRKRP